MKESKQKLQMNQVHFAEPVQHNFAKTPKGNVDFKGQDKFIGQAHALRKVESVGNKGDSSQVDEFEKLSLNLKD